MKPIHYWFTCFFLLASVSLCLAQTVEGELRRWHKVTLTFDGPNVSETANPNPFSDYRMTVTFTHNGSGRSYAVPGYYAACGDAAETSCTTGDQWRVHFAPDRPGTWNWSAELKTGSDVAINGGGSSAGFFDGQSGSLSIQESNKSGDDLRAPDKGRIQYVNQHYLRHSGTTPDQPSGDWFLKAGADAPENMLSYNDFDAIPNPKKTWQPHQQDYNAAEAASYTWQGGKGSEMLGVVRYLTELKGVNAMSFLTFSLDGDDKTIAPHLTQTGNGDKWSEVYHDRFDVSKTDQWERIFEYATTKGMFLHFKTQETENDQKMDGGAVGRERQLYYRWLIARFGHHLALNWNLGEENTQTTSQRQAMAQYFYDHDPYRHLVVMHTYPGDKNNVYTPLLGSASEMTGVSLQTNYGNDTHNDVVEWIERSANAGKPWAVACDEQGNAQLGVDVDPNDRHRVRDEILWATFLGGGWGVEYYYGYGTGCTDLTCQDHRTRDQKYTDAAYALHFMRDYFMPYLPEVVNRDNESSSSGSYLLRSEDKSAYLVYLPNGGSTDISGLPSGTHTLRWFNPRNGNLGSSQALTGNNLSAPNGDDWLAFIETNGSTPPPPPSGMILEEVNGVLAIEAEHFDTQSQTQHREWYLTEPGNTPNVSPDPDGNHASSASGNAYLEILPDTRVTHSDPLVQGVSFSNTPGQITIIDYQVYINNPGRYYVWVRAYSTGTEDNGVHVGLDGNWPSSGARMQWCQGKNQWTWESKQRTNANHCGEPQLIYLDINTPGLHTISFSQREDGFEMDKIVLTDNYTKPQGMGPPEVVYGGGSNPCAGNQAPSINLTQPSNGFSLQQGDALTLNVNVSDPDNNVDKVEFYQNGQKIGEDTQAPYSFNTVASIAGTVSYTAKATDDCGASATSAAATGTVAGTPPPSGTGEIAFVGDNANSSPNAGDQSVIARLQAMGFNVTAYDDDNVSSSAANGKDMVYISSTTLSNNVAATFRDATVPVVVCESHLFDDMKMASNYGSDAGKTDLVITNNSHPLGQGLPTGRFTAFTTGTELVWGNPLSSAIVIANHADANGKKGVFAYEGGSQLDGMQAPARRVGLFPHDDGLVNATPQAMILWENAICWAMGGCGTTPMPIAVTGVDVAPNSLALEVTETGTLTATVSPGNADNQAVTWASSDPAIATIDANGEVTALAPGTATITATTDDGGFTATSDITVEAPSTGQAPFGGNPWPIPGKIEVEDFDEGGAGVAFEDGDGNNNGGQYRNTAVDIQTTSDNGGGFNVGWIRQDEWLEYTVDVQQAGDYEFAFRVASRSAGGTLHLEMDGVDITGPVSFAKTNGWQTWTTVTTGPIALSPGEQVMRLSLDANSFNINYLEATLADTSVVPPAGTDTQTLVLSPIHDAYLQNGSLRNESIIRVENASRTRVGYFRFDLSSVPGQILDAQLKLTCASDPGDGAITIAQGDNSVWTETNLSTSNAPAAMQPLATLDRAYQLNQEYAWSLGAVSASGSALNLVMTQDQGDITADVAFASKEYGTPSYRPQLILTVATPSSQRSLTPEVEWVSLEAQPEIDQVRLNWLIEKEQAIDFYELERSIDGLSFQTLDMVPSLGFTTSERMYDILDVNPLAQHRYYRIRAVGANGYLSYSPVVNLDQADVLVNWTVYPNPLETDQQLNIDLEIPQPETLEVGVFNYQGSQVLGKTETLTQTIGTITLDINALSPGLYIISVRGANWVKSERIVVEE